MEKVSSVIIVISIAIVVIGFVSLAFSDWKYSILAIVAIIAAVSIFYSVRRQG
jgi:hypothetical protein